MTVYFTADLCLMPGADSSFDESISASLMTAYTSLYSCPMPDADSTIDDLVDASLIAACWMLWSPMPSAYSSYDSLVDAPMVGAAFSGCPMPYTDSSFLRKVGASLVTACCSLWSAMSPADAPHSGLGLVGASFMTAQQWRTISLV
eukprot:CAMPEP_0201957418 /NCGR_PEP_ID=MMETSP0904-20121228/4784_1 /ASSEMBLY_ACC=CAM_ASM_000553 /TAXON_ID=420261 /ORGANISM="Thalassiosira antarctica, Strain CCMP982" /LENGTH=145 /DNA_ID=CAMNT_0048502423 /DNA_START=161 /DNA_END=595 /DNA_ORIENTATION=-